MGRLPSIRLALVLALLPFALRGQETVTLKYFGMTIHPFGDRTAKLQPYKLDDKARFVLNFGGFAGYERYIHKELFAVKIIQGVFTDCAGGLSGVTHVGLRVLLIEHKKHRLMCGIGPAFMYRDSWRRFGDQYEPSGFFNDYHSRALGDIQWKLFPAGFEFEYDAQLCEKLDLSVSFTPGLPLACTFAVGVKYWLNKDFISNEVKLVRPSRKEKKRAGRK